MIVEIKIDNQLFKAKVEGRLIDVLLDHSVKVRSVCCHDSIGPIQSRDPCIAETSISLFDPASTGLFQA